MALDRRRAGARFWADLGPFRLVRENGQHVLGVPADAQRPQQLLGGRAADVQQRLDPHAVILCDAAVDAPAGRPRADHSGQPPAPCDVGLLGPNGVGLDNTRGNMAISLQVALSQAGFGLPVSDPAKLDACKIVFAIGRQAVSTQEAERLQRYVAGGGTLVFTPRFASQTEAGVTQPVAPGGNLAQQWQFRVTDRSASIAQYHSGEIARFPLDGLSDALRGTQAAGLTVFREQVQHEGWSALAEYADHTPAILTRTMGQGRLVYLNAVYQSHHYIQWVTPTDADRQGFYQLVQWLCEQAGARRTMRLDGRLDEVLHVAVKQFTDPTGHIRYAILRTSGEVPWAGCRLRWLGPETACYDVLGGEAARAGSGVGHGHAVRLSSG